MESTSVSNPQALSIASRQPEILFLCTGNYYRSRFAEELFNYLAAADSMALRATSRGFTPHPDINPGSISAHTLLGLKSRNINPANAIRMPAPVQIDDFVNHKHCIALSETEHRPMMNKMFPEFLSRVRFWKVEDLAWETPENALLQIEKEVQKLLDELR